MPVTPIPRPRRSMRTPVLAGVLALALCAAGSLCGVARAGVFVWFQCASDVQNTAIGLDSGWQAVASGTQPAGLSSQCSSNRWGSIANDFQQPPNSVEGVAFTIPGDAPDESFADVMEAGQSAGYSGSEVFAELLLSGQVVDNVLVPSAGGQTVLSDGTPPANARSIDLLDFCSTSASEGCTFNDALSPALGTLETKILDTSLPTASATGGTLLSGPQRGTASIQVTAAEPDSGLMRWNVAGQEIDNSPGVGQCNELDSFHPCPTSQVETFQIDTTAYQDGPHVLQANLTTAAITSNTVTLGTFTTFNAPQASANPGAPGIDVGDLAGVGGGDFGS
jgi:hypothetical protein